MAPLDMFPPFRKASAAKKSIATIAASTGGSASSNGEKQNNTSTAGTINNLSTLENLNFANTFTTELPADPLTNNTPRQVENAFFSYVNPSGTGTEPTSIAVSTEVATMIGIDPGEADRPEFALVFSGNALLPGDTKPYAQCYGGHQFGSWAGQLGDGRAICLGEILNSQTGIRWELQLKGAGRTPYSRFADGRAVLRSSIREYVASEAMAALGVPTTRALSLVLTGDDVLRDMFYNGNAQMEPGAVVCRVAQSFIRFGTFQLPASRGEDQKVLVKTLADFVIRHFYLEECSSSSSGRNSTTDVDSSLDSSTTTTTTTTKNQYALLLEAIAKRTGHVVSEWHRVGFVHGVLNTDNMSILGDTIDYGPYGWLERYDPDFTPNTTDLPGRRYCFHAQPEIGQFNILQLARSFIAGGLITEDEAREGLVAYGTALTDRFSTMMGSKMGLKTYDRVLANGLLKAMYEDSADYTNTFRALSSVSMATPPSGDDGEIPAELISAVGLDELPKDRTEVWSTWVKEYRSALRTAGWKDDEERKKVQNNTNPVIVPRNHVLVGIISEATVGNYGALDTYMKALRQPYTDDGEIDAQWKEPGPKQSRMGVELLSCSS
jgi:uncharacterized protein YdiU (UPF0061 family)